MVVASAGQNTALLPQVHLVKIYETPRPYSAESIRVLTSFLNTITMTDVWASAIHRVASEHLLGCIRFMSAQKPLVKGYMEDIWRRWFGLLMTAPPVEKTSCEKV